MLDLDAIEARAETATLAFRRLSLHLPPLADLIRNDAVELAAAAIPALVAELRAAREVVEAAPVAITLRTDEAFYGAMNRLADALAAYRAVVGEQE